MVIHVWTVKKYESEKLDNRMKHKSDVSDVNNRRKTALCSHFLNKTILTLWKFLIMRNNSKKKHFEDDTHEH